MSICNLWFNIFDNLITLDDFLRVLSIYNQYHLFSIASVPECEYFKLNREDCDEGLWTNKNVDSLQGVALGSIRIEILGPYCTAHWHLFSIASAPECEYFELNREDCDEGSWTSKIVDSLQGVALGSIRIKLLGPYCTAHWHLFSIASAPECEYFACYFLLNCKAPYFSLFFDCYLKMYSLT